MKCLYHNYSDSKFCFRLLCNLRMYAGNKYLLLTNVDSRKHIPSIVNIFKDDTRYWTEISNYRSLLYDYDFENETI